MIETDVIIELMVVERKKLTRPKGQFAKEKTQRYHPVEGSFERALIILKDVFSEETFGVSDTSFWSGVERKAAELSERQVCFQYYLAGIGHLTLADNLLRNFTRVRAGLLTGDIPSAQYDQWRDRLSDALLAYYPQRYRDKLSKKK